MLILIVAGGPDKGRIYELKEDEAVIIGRESDQIRLSDRKISRKHIRVWAEGGKWYLRDLNSRHGTRLNGETIDGRREINDGDHVRLGKSLLVLARMTVEQAERFALLHHAAEDDATVGRAGFGNASRRSGLLAAGLAVAAGAVLASNAWLYTSSEQRAAELRDELAQAQRAAAQTQSLLAELRDRETAPDVETAQALQRILAAVEGSAEHGQTLSQILAKVDARPEAEREMAHQLQEVLARLDRQPDITPLVEEVRTLAVAAKEQQDVLAVKADRQHELLQTAVTEIQARPDGEQLASALQSAAAADAQANAALLEQILSGLQEQKALGQRLADLQEALGRQPEVTQAALRDALATLPQQGDGEILEALVELQRTMPQDVSDKLDRVLQHVAGAATPEQIATALRNVLDRRESATVATLEKLAAKIDAQPSGEALVARLDEVLQAQPTATQVLQAIEQAKAEPDARLLARIDELSRRLEASQQELLQRVQDDEAARQLASQQQQTQQLLGAVLEEVRNREPIDHLRQHLEKLAAAASAPAPVITPEDDDAKLDQILAAVQAQRQAEVQLAEIHQRLQAWPVETDAMLKQVLAAVEARAASPDTDAFASALQDIRDRALARMDELAVAVRNDLRRQIQQDVLRNRSTRPGAATSTNALASRSGTRPVAGVAGADGAAVLMSPLLQEETTVSAEEPALSPLERAYKLAFESGKPVTIGAGVEDPVTGEKARGRTLDPASARAAGLSHWREWYLMDGFAERMRLQKEALRYTAAEDRPATPTIQLPGNDADGQ